MICKVKHTIEKYRLLEGVSSLAVGVSGGADSMSLLEILSKLKDEYGIILKSVHINHGIRGEEALRDQRLVEEFSKSLGIECLSFYYDIPSLSKETGIGEEECGRLKRYEAYKLSGCDAVATAHTLSDSIETTVFNLIRGTGAKGLCGIPAKRENIIRPLIECTRDEVEVYCRENNIAFVTDTTNLSDDYTRNFIRHNIIPAFRKVNGSFERAVASATETLRAENEYLENISEALLKNAELEGGFRADIISSANPAVRRRAIAGILNSNMQKDTEKRHIDLVEAALLKGEGKVEVSKNLFVKVADNRLLFQGTPEVFEQWQTEGNEGVFETPFGKYIIKAASPQCRGMNLIDADKLTGKLIMSSRKQGDSFYIKKRGLTKSLKKLFNEVKIPADKRNSIAVLRDDSGVIWVEGFGTDGKYLPDINTKNVLIIKKEG